ncbi:MAG: hypothetical protein Q9190_001742 [Brigantiaea leucoxantha]
MSNVPSVACIGVIGKHDNPLHIALFPPHSSTKGAYLEFSFLLNASLDIFELRTRDKNRVDQDLGMLQAVDERLSIWGWETGTGTRFAIILDMWGREGRPSTGPSVKDGELKPVGPRSFYSSILDVGDLQALTSLRHSRLYKWPTFVYSRIRSTLLKTICRRQSSKAKRRMTKSLLRNSLMKSKESVRYGDRELPTFETLLAKLVQA